MLHHNKESRCCYHCGNALNGQFVHAPFQFVSGVFHMWGYFCNFECGREYNDFYKVERVFMNLYLKRKYNVPLVFSAHNPITDIDLDTCTPDIRETFINCLISAKIK